MEEMVSLRIKNKLALKNNQMTLRVMMNMVTQQVKMKTNRWMVNKILNLIKIKSLNKMMKNRRQMDRRIGSLLK